MPELPEIIVIAKQMDQILRGKNVESISIVQPKCGNRPVQDYLKYLSGRKVERIFPLGKWIEIVLDQQTRFLISLGMGGEICYFKKSQTPPEKSRLIVRFSDRTGFYVTLWWFGYFHLVLKDETHPMTEPLGPDPLKLSEDEFLSLLMKKKGKIKFFLMNQKRIRGIGNFYIQEILFRAGIHPLCEIGSLQENKKRDLYRAIRKVLEESISLGSSSYEFDFFGEKGEYGLDRMSIGYQEDKPCPSCGTKIKKIKTGSTSQFICPQCQILP
jgi:formamidopyrimidine-DNA glycosylase